MLCEQCGIRSTTLLAGREDVLADEDSELRPLSLYARTKVDVERHLIGRRGATATLRILGAGPRASGLLGHRTGLSLLAEDLAGAGKRLEEPGLSLRLLVRVGVGTVGGEVGGVDGLHVRFIAGCAGVAR